MLEYIEEVFIKVENLSQETKKLSSQKSADQVSEQTTTVSSATPPLSAQSSCDDTTKLSETPEQSEEDLRTLLEIRVKILNQFCERYKYIKEQLRKCSQSTTTETPPEEVKPLPKAEQQLSEIPNASELEQEFTNASELEQQFTNLSSAKPNSGAALAAAASATLTKVAVEYVNLINKLPDRQVRLEEMQKRIENIRTNINSKSQTSILKPRVGKPIVMTA